SAALRRRCPCRRGQSHARSQSRPDGYHPRTRAPLPYLGLSWIGISVWAGAPMLRRCHGPNLGQSPIRNQQVVHGSPGVRSDGREEDFIELFSIGGSWLWDVLSRQMSIEFTGRSRVVFSVAWEPDGKRIASAG